MERTQLMTVGRIVVLITALVLAYVASRCAGLEPDYWEITMATNGVRMIVMMLSVGVVCGCGNEDHDDGTPRVTPTPALTASATPTVSPSPETCSSFYAGRVSEPLVKPAGDIHVRSSGVVRFEQVGSAEDVLHAVVDGQLVDPDRSLMLSSGTNAVDFVVTGEGEVHDWHVVFTVDGTVVFEHEQMTLEPRRVCEGELYRFHLVFVVD